MYITLRTYEIKKKVASVDKYYLKLIILFSIFSKRKSLRQKQIKRVVEPMPNCKEQQHFVQSRIDWASLEKILLKDMRAASEQIGKTLLQVYKSIYNSRTAGEDIRLWS